MNLVLDTHAFLWWIIDDDRLSFRARSLIESRENELFLSAATGWEIAIKARLGRIHLPGRFDSFIARQLTQNAIHPLPVHMSHALHVYNLPDHHRDPFDRILIAQAQLENLTILTMDPQIARYRIKVVW